MAVRAADRVELVPAENLKDQVPVPAPAENLQAPVPVPEDNPEDPEVVGSLAASAARVAVLAMPVSPAADSEAVVVLVAAAMAVVGLTATSPFVVPRAVSGPDRAEAEPLLWLFRRGCRLIRWRPLLEILWLIRIRVVICILIHGHLSMIFDYQSYISIFNYINYKLLSTILTSINVISGGAKKRA